MLILALSMSACASTAPSGTDAVCDALRPVLPTYSSQDTEQTRVEGLRFLDTFAAVCP
jgi:type IV pilus biogenesis protein CpaD/CtpE